MKFSGEQVVWTDMKGDNGEPQVLLDHLDRYLYAMHYVHNKTVLDAAAGTCYGSWLLSMLASKVYSVDIAPRALKLGKTLPYASEREMIVADLEKDELPEADVCVSFETIEHLETPFFLEHLKCKELIYSIPLNPVSEDGQKILNVNPFHKLIFIKPEQALEYMEKAGWKTYEWSLQNSSNFVGRAIRA